MYTKRDIDLKIILPFAWKTVLFFLLYSLIICLIDAWFNYRFSGIPFLPVGLIGTAVAFSVGFKNNASYERLWEARRIWGSLTNLSRSFGILVLSYVKPDSGPSASSKVHQELLYRHLAFINALRIQLRSRSIWANMPPTSQEVVNHYTSFTPETLRST